MGKRSQQRADAMARTLILAYLAVQIIVPAVRLPHHGLARFGWQMFSRIDAQPGIRVIFADHVDSTSVTSARSAMRADLQLPPDFPRQVCAHYPAATAVRIGHAPEVRCR